MTYDSPDLPAAPVLGERYEISRRLREEPWGEVWLARDRLLGEEVGLKVLPGKPRNGRRPKGITSRKPPWG